MRSSIAKLGLASGGSTLFPAVLAALLFLVAGRWDLPWFWSCVALYGVFCFLGLLLVDPALIRERQPPGPGARDTVSVYVGKALATALYVVAALDIGRFQWSGSLPLALQATAVGIVVLSAMAIVWTMVVNPFFTSGVRLQEERGHRVVTDGPYRIMRHPGYVVISVLMLASGVVLGSWWALVPAWAFVLMLIRRTIVEDRFLHEHLPGYAEYARDVRYRLIPGVW